ncbi:hypothetical protein THIOM_001602 [Candidatus Thiomargarita nelsonii]|uniref:Uncharacterized protein n=1 Tax=Candidatus Thiomargarita nelsonii TaxID=1003181 RepID=A0A176S3K9_9GAMM|nr:hypothetical protein THIOM_001602 [Candidatus Thiomargarita nelsonii]
MPFFVGAIPCGCPYLNLMALRCYVQGTPCTPDDYYQECKAYLAPKILLAC